MKNNKCKECDGSGSTADRTGVCDACQGTGKNEK